MIKLQNVTKIYEGSDYKTTALDEVNLVIEKGEFLAIMGPSGSGKTTLLNIIGCMDTPSSGSYFLDGEDVSKYSSTKLTGIRKNYISFVFQNFGLLQDYTVYENIEVPLLAKNVRRSERKQRMDEKMKLLGIEGMGNKLPSQLSGGQQQRVSIARVLAADNPILLADEPTGALDQNTGKELMQVLQDLNKQGKTIILVTHNPEIAEMTGKTLEICDGQCLVKA